MITTYSGNRFEGRRRTKKFIQDTRRQRYPSYKRNSKKRGKGRKPHKLHKQGNSKWATHVLTYINEEEQHHDNILFDTAKFGLSDFEKIHAFFVGEKQHMINQLYPEKLRRKACEDEFNNNILPNLTEEKFHNLDPAKLFTWTKTAADALPEVEDGRASRVQNALSNYTKKEMFVLQKLFKQFPTLKAWEKENFGKDIAFGKRSVFSSKEARAFANLAGETLGYRLHFMNRCFENESWRERIDNFYYQAQESDWRTRKCCGCQKEFWMGEMTPFNTCISGFPSCNDERHCPKCFSKLIKRNAKSDKGTFHCGKACECFWDIESQNGGYKYAEKTLNLSEDKLKKIVFADYQRFVLDRYEKIPDQILSNPDMTAVDLLNISTLKRRLDAILRPVDFATDVAGVVERIEELFKMMRLKTKFPVLDEAVDALISKFKLGSVAAECKPLLNPIQQILLDRPDPTKKAIPDYFGMSMYDITNMKLQRAKDALTAAYSISAECSICMTVSNPKETDILTLHTDMDEPVTEWNHHPHDHWKSFKLPCHTCKDCFSNYLNFKKALGKPALKCPGMNCGCHLKKSHIKSAMPVAYADYEASLMRYSLKKVRNFRTCPNADCSAGLVLDIDCNVGKVTCSACSFSFCPHCNDTPHEGMTCEEMRRQRHKERWGETKDYMENETKQCPFCLAWIEKNGGCNHMTCCHCRGEFCWLCFGDWKGHDSCEDKKVVVRRPFNELFPDWLQKTKVLLPRFSVGKYVEIASDSTIGRVASVESDGIYVVEPVNSSFLGMKKIEESFLRGYNQPIALSISAEEAEAIEEAAYSSFLAGFEPTEVAITPPPSDYVSVELTTCDNSLENLTAKQLLQKYASKVDTKVINLASLKASNTMKRLKTLKEKRKERAKREKAREQPQEADSDEDSVCSTTWLFPDSDDEESVDPSAYLFLKSYEAESVDPSAYLFPESDEEESSSVMAPSLHPSLRESFDDILGDLPDPEHGAFSDDEDSVELVRNVYGSYLQATLQRA